MKDNIPTIGSSQILSRLRNAVIFIALSAAVAAPVIILFTRDPGVDNLKTQTVKGQDDSSRVAANETRDQPHEELAANLKDSHNVAVSAVDSFERTVEKTVSANSPTSYIFEPRTEEEFEGDVEERRRWFIYQRMFPFDELPEQAREKAWESRPHDAVESAAASRDEPAALQWQPIGPTPTTSYFINTWGKTSGRINSIAVSPTNPNLVLIGAATGGVWRSTDGGTNFTPVSDSQVDLAVGSIAFAPSNASIVYAGMGDKDGGYLGTGVLRSSDGGVTWSRVSNNSLPNYGLISQILVDAADPNRVYLAQYAFSQSNTLFGSGFFYSTDGGVNWIKTMVGTAKDLVRHPTQPGTMYLTVASTDLANGSNAGVFKSTNNGQNWTRVFTSPFGTADNIKVAVTAIAPENVYVLVGKSGVAQLNVSTNGGSTWVNRGANFDTGQFGYNCYVFVHPTDPNTIFVGTRDLWRSSNGGSTYTNITNNFSISGNYTPSSARAHPDQHHFYISPSSPSTLYVANDGGLWKSVNGGTSFTSLNSTLSLTMFTSYDLHPTDASRSYGGTQDNGTQRRTGGQTWQEFATGDGGQTFVDTLDPTIVYATYITHTVFRFTNNGDSAPVVIGNANVFNSDRVSFYPPFVGNDTNSTIYFGTYRLYVSTNRGANWSTPGGFTDLTFGTNNSFLSAIAVARSNTSVIYTGATDGRVMVSTSGGVSWNDRTAGLPQRFIKSITIAANDPNTAYLTVSGYGSGHVFKTSNAGVSWTNISGNLPDIPCNTLLIDPRAGNSNTLYVGTDIGVFRSTVGGTTWETFNNGLPPTVISELDAQPNGLLQAGTYGRGAFEINLNDSTTTTFQFSAATYSVNENAGTATITVNRGGSSTGAASVSFATANGTATAGSDYTAASGTLNFASGETTKTFNVSIADDTLAEGNETINLTLSSPGGGAGLGSPSTAVLTINDNETTCSFTLNPTSQSFTSSGGSNSFTVTTAAGCSWAATSNVTWVTTSSSGSGNGTVNYTVASNSGAARNGTMTVGGQTFTVNQGSGGGCPSTPITAGQTINGTITTADCFFIGTTRYVDVYNFSGTAGQQITITMNSSVFDTYLYLLDSNNQLLTENDDGGGGTNSRIPAFSGTFTLPAAGTYTIYATSYSFDGVTGETGAYSITLMGATSCSYNISPSSQSFGPSGGSGSFGVTAPSGCSWLAMSDSLWITTNSSGSGNGAVNYTVLANSGAARTGTIMINNQTFTVTQGSGGGGCPSTAISAGQTINGSLAFGDCIFIGTSRNVDVYNFTGTAGQQVALTMSSSIFDTYLYLLDSANQLLVQDDDGGGGTNSRIPSFSGTFTLPASGTYTIYATSYSFDGYTGSTGPYTISLISPTNCNYNINPATQNVGSTASNNSFNITVQSGCSWAAFSNALWISTTSSGAGNGIINYSVATNSGAARSGTIGVAGQTFTVNQAAAPANTIGLGAAGFNINEGGGFVNITVNRSGDMSGVASVGYFTGNGTAREGKDYLSASGVLNFAAGETTKTFPVLIIDNAFVAGSRTVNVTLNNPIGATLSGQSSAVLTIAENDAVVGANPVDQPRSFVQLDYYDFLGRYPDPSGWDFWTNQITNCGANAQCIEVQRINVSASFFLSIEFQQTGYLVERMYKTAYGDATATSTFPATHQLSVPIIRFSEYLTDTQRIGRGVIVLQTGWEQLLENNKQAYALEFVQTSRFQTVFPITMTPAQFVDKLNQNAGNVLSASERTAVINVFGGAPVANSTTARAQAVRQVAEDVDLYNAEYNRAFVLAEYYGYLRRNPNDAPESTLDYTGYDFWLTKLNQFNGNYVNAEMVKAFLSSIEYRQRFGP